MRVVIFRLAILPNIERIRIGVLTDSMRYFLWILCVSISYGFYAWYFLRILWAGIFYGFLWDLSVFLSDSYSTLGRTLLIFVHKNTPAKITLKNEQNSAITQHQLNHTTSTMPRPWDFRLPLLVSQSNNQPETLPSLPPAYY